MCGRLGDRRHIIKTLSFRGWGFWFNPSFLGHPEPGLSPISVMIFIPHPLPSQAKVKRRGPTTFLWIKLIFGICGELWLIFGFCGLVSICCRESLVVQRPLDGFFECKNVVKSVVIGARSWLLAVRFKSETSKGKR